MSRLRELHYLRAMGYDFCPLPPSPVAAGSAADLCPAPTHPDLAGLFRTVRTCSLCVLGRNRPSASSHSTPPTLAPQLSQGPRLMILSLLPPGPGGADFLPSTLAECLGPREAAGVYFASLLKCPLVPAPLSSQRPSAPRSALPPAPPRQALASCLPYFFEEFALVRPRALLCLGRVCFEALGFGDFASLRGQVLGYLGTVFMASFEPDFLERNPSKKPLFKADLKRLEKFLGK